MKQNDYSRKPFIQQTTRARKRLTWHVARERTEHAPGITEAYLNNALVVTLHVAAYDTEVSSITAFHIPPPPGYFHPFAGEGHEKKARLAVQEWLTGAVDRELKQERQRRLKKARKRLGLLSVDWAK